MEAWESTYDLVLPELKTRLFEGRMLVGPGVQLNDLLCCDKFDVTADIHRIKLLALVIRGSDDKVFSGKQDQGC